MEWAYMGAGRFTEPFCHETLHKLALRPFNQLFRKRSSPELLIGRAKSHPGLPLGGLVFHMSRCGSTLVSQYLSALRDSVVLSEPEPVGSALRCSPPGNEALLRGMISALGQARRSCDRTLYLKAECEHVLDIDRYLAAFPGTPWVFVYRNPLEVLVSHERNPGWFRAMNSMSFRGLQPPAECYSDLSGGCAWILSLVLRHAVAAMRSHENGLLVNYSELPCALRAVARHFGVACTDAEAAMEIARTDAKRGGAFVPDSEEKRSAADPGILEVAECRLDEPYRQLEELRLAKRPRITG